MGARAGVAGIGPLLASAWLGFLSPAPPPPPEGAAAEVRAADDPPADRGGGLLALPIVGYGPETGIAGGAAAIYSFSLRPDRPSRLRALAKYTQQEQLVVRLGPELYWGDHHLELELEYRRFPSSFYGIGAHTGESDREDYTPVVWQGALAYDHRVFSRLYAGASFDIAHTEMLAFEPDGWLARGATGADGGWTVGAGLLLAWDTRDNTASTRRGVLAQLGVRQYTGLLGSDYDFLRLDLDLRWFVPLPNDHVLAFQGLAQSTFGDVPFDHLASLGGKKLLRGLSEGRFTDRHALAAQAEYRLPLFWRLGLAGFAAVGDVAPALDAFDFQRPKVAVGGGLRFTLKEGGDLKARIDGGWSEGETKIYFELGEAF